MIGSLRRILLLVTSLVVSLPCTPARAGARPPNVILCMADDQGWGDVGYHDHPHLRTPTLDAMAANGLVLDRFYAAAPVCSPTRGSVLTGRHPNRFGCYAWGHTLRGAEVTIAETLRDAGYVTGHFGKWHLGSMRPGDPDSPGRSGFDEWCSSANFFDNDPRMCRNGKVVRMKGESSMVVVDAALEFIRAAAVEDRPFLAVVWFGSPHTPHVADPTEQRPYAELPEAERNYFGEVGGIDRAVGKLRRELRTLRIEQDTLLWYTSDNGSRRPGSTGGLRGQKGSLWDGGLRVPTIIEWPARIPRARISTVRGNTSDIYPTIVDAVDIRPVHRPPLDGISLLPVIDGQTRPRETPMGFWVHPVGGRGMRADEILAAIEREQNGGAPAPPLPDPPDAQRGKGGHAAWIDGNHKLHRIPDGEGFRYELYELESDPAEGVDIATREPDRVRRMSAALDAWQDSVLASGFDHADDPAE